MRRSRNALLCPALVLPFALTPTFAATHPAVHTPTAGATPASLPVTRVSLYKNGVGFFEHAGHITGNQSVTIDFTTAQLNDVLQSLTAIDLNGGRISGAGYNSTTPLEQQLRSLPLGLNAAPTAAEFYNAIRGARVEVTGSGATITGRLLSLEIRGGVSDHDEKPTLERRFLTVVSETGGVRSVELTPATQVRLLDGNLHTDVNRYLELLDTNRNQGLRHLTLEDRGTGARELRVSYISEVPVWKSTYRILFTERGSSIGKQTATLQGWSVVDNTTGADWNNVELSLIAGAPQSFIQPLSTPYYARRPEIPLPQEAQLTPQTHESGEGATDIDAKIDNLPLNGRGGVMLAAPKLRSNHSIGSGSGAGMGSGAGAPGGVMGGIGAASETVTVNAAPQMAYQEMAVASITPNTTTNSFDDFFEYKLSEPITIRKNESALVPILQTKIDAERVTLWSPSRPVALRALWITNTSNLTLDRGSFSIVENGNFGGEGLLDPIHPNERRLLSYAADQAVRVTVDNSHDTRHVQRLSIARGVLKEESSEVQEVEYKVHNAAADARTIIVEQPLLHGWTLDSASGRNDSDPKPDETTSDAYRFRVATQAGETVRLHLAQSRTLNQTYRLVNTSDDQLTLILRNAHASQALLAQLETIFAAKRAVADLDRQIKAKQSAIDELVKDQDRLRANLAALKGTAEERDLAKRYTAELNQQEDTLATLHKDLDSLKQQHEAAQQELSSKIESLSADEAV